MARNPVILVHGILGQRHIYWNVFKRRLARDGFRFHDCILPYGMLGDMRIAAHFLRDKINATLQATEARKVDLVCHSAGGLVARYYLMYLGGHKHVQRLITLGTPHQGTYFSYLFGPPMAPVSAMARQARPGSHFLAEINGAGAIPEGVEVHNLWSPVDGIIWPHQNARLPGSHDHMLPFTTHWGFLWRREAYEAVRERLAPGEPAAGQATRQGPGQRVEAGRETRKGAGTALEDAEEGAGTAARDAGARVGTPRGKRARSGQRLPDDKPPKDPTDS